MLGRIVKQLVVDPIPLGVQLGDEIGMMTGNVCCLATITGKVVEMAGHPDRARPGTHERLVSLVEDKFELPSPQCSLARHAPEQIVFGILRALDQPRKQ